MKLTDEIKTKLSLKLTEIMKSGTDCREVAIHLARWALESIAQLPENTAQWIHCSERLPADEETDSTGYVHTWEHGQVYRFHIEGLSAKENFWWIPAPKNLTPPPPKDPFEEIWAGSKESLWPFPSVFLENDVKNAMKKAFEAGKQSK